MPTDTCEFGRRCEAAWQEHLGERGHQVTPLCAAVGNVTGTRAPMLKLANGQEVRAPDFQTRTAPPGGRIEYWEVKGRSRPHRNRTTGALVHFTDHARFADYAALHDSWGDPVWLVVYEAATASSPPRWLKIDVADARRRGYPERRMGPDGYMIDFWNWPIDAMEEIPGPLVEMSDLMPPIIPAEVDAPSPSFDELRADELAMRKADQHREPRRASVGRSAFIEQDHEAMLEQLRQRLGIPDYPNYSVLHIGVLEPADLLGLLNHGIRVFLIVGDDAQRNQVLAAAPAFADVGMFECGVVADRRLLDPYNGRWFADGKLVEDAGFRRLLVAADEHGGFGYQQFNIVHADSSADIVVEAGAGTGKTESMAERIMFLLSTSNRTLKPADIAMVTFTREAAAQMRTRLARTLGLRQRLCPRCVQPARAWLMQLSQCRISTLHWFAKDLLDEFGAAIGYAPGVRTSALRDEFCRIRDEELSERLAGTFGHDVPAFHECTKHVDALWSALENNGVPIMGGDARIDWGEVRDGADIALRVSTAFHQTIASLGERLAEESRRAQAVPTGQLIPMATRALHQSGGVVSSRPIRYLFVDEFQDTDALQMEMLLELRKRDKAMRIFAVGDAKQAIYRFRGAQDNAFAEFANQWAQAQLPERIRFGLTRNFRSGRTLLDSLHELFADWGGTLGGDEVPLLPYMEADRLRHNAMAGMRSIPARDVPAASAIEIVRLPRQGVYALQAAGWVERYFDEFEDRRICVLCRTNAQAKEVAHRIRELDDRRQQQGRTRLDPYLVVGGEFFVQRAVLELRALVRALMYPQDDAALIELMETRWAIGICRPNALVAEVPASEGERQAWQAELPHDAPLDWMSRLGSLARDGSYRRDDLDALRMKVGYLRCIGRNLGPLAFLVECARLLRPEDAALPTDKTPSERSDYQKDLNHALALIEEGLGSSRASLGVILDWLSLQVASNRTEDRPGRDTDSRVTVMTVHKAKGLEFDAVLVPHTWRAIGMPGDARSEVRISSGREGRHQVSWRWTPPRATREVRRQDDARKPQQLPLPVEVSCSDEWDRTDWEAVREETRLLYVALTRAKLKLTVFVRAAGGPENCWQDRLRGEQ